MSIAPVYSEATIAAALARGMFADALCVVDGCGWPEYECDLLVVNQRLRVIDVEIKISRADLRADRKKGKWFTYRTWREGDSDGNPRERRMPRDWPKRVWKHYYAVAAPIWKAELLEHCGQMSGVLLVDLAARGPTKYDRGVDVIRRATPNRKDIPISAGDAIAIARLASLRMWDAYDELEKNRTQITVQGTMK
jgi:hypothetical protein